MKMKKIEWLILKLKRKADQIEYKEYISSLMKQCELGENAKLYQECVIFDGHSNMLGGGVKYIKIGRDTHVKGELLTLGHGGEIIIGDYSYIGGNTHIWSGGATHIGDRVLIGSDCYIFDNDIHPLNSEIRHRQFMDIVTIGQPAWITLNDSTVTIEDDAWIGCNVVILKGVTIGKGAVIGAGSVVTHDIPAHAIAHGNPAKVYRVLQE